MRPVLTEYAHELIRAVETSKRLRARPVLGGGRRKSRASLKDLDPLEFRRREAARVKAWKERKKNEPGMNAQRNHRRRGR